MYFFRRKHLAPVIELLTSDGLHTPLQVTFRDGEIHINAEAMDRGSYQLVINDGKNSEFRQFTIQ
jgi:hypothetical protein